MKLQEWNVFFEKSSFIDKLQYVSLGITQNTGIGGMTDFVYVFF